ncbi:hypothetical protein [Fortiea sp. LEGE XX443]|uniref:hypothetical protein n=1 Tax=Fortiea sp. LEGE XX443 TaxID=1828611 RepID=UPI0030DAB9B9
MYSLIKPNVRLEAIARLLHRSGARIGEVLGLSLSEVNQEQRKFQLSVRSF